jgi:hypothetical protein
VSGYGEEFYSAEERGELPDAAVLASLGCGNPLAVAELREGETVLDLGSGGSGGGGVRGRERHLHARGCRRHARAIVRATRTTEPDANGPR